MDKDVARYIANEVEKSMRILIGVIDFVRENTSSDEQFPLIQALGEVLAVQTDKIVPFLLSKQPELEAEIAPWLDDDEPRPA
jgi:hypothetical protein